MSEDSFIGSKFGSLAVIGIAGKNKHGSKLYQCVCSVCSEDEELFGDGIFRSTKDKLVRGVIPCGCSNRTKWSTTQYRILLSRKSNGRYSVIVLDDVKVHDKVQCTCLIEGCGHTWEARVNDLLNNGHGCMKCADRAKAIPEDEAVSRIQSVCSDKGWSFNGFKGGWKNAYSKLNLKCHCGCNWSPEYNSTVNNKLGCPSCAKTGYSPDKSGTFYTYLWTDPDTNHSFLKYGISNRPKQRLTQQKSKTKYVPTKLCSINFDDGNVPANLEKQIDEYKKTNSITSPVSKSEFPDGWTETLPIEEWLYLANLIQSETMCKLSPIPVLPNKKRPIPTEWVIEE